MNRNQENGMFSLHNTRQSRNIRKAIALFVLLGLCVHATTWAGAFIFAGETYGADIILHPSGYTGTSGPLNVGVCIDSSSANASQLQIPVQNNIFTWNNLQPTVGNVTLNVLGTGLMDLESVLLHEMGHCIGLAHVNLASESGLTGDDQNYTKSTDGTNNVFDIDPGDDGVRGSADDIRGDDVNLHWFNPDNDPFLIPIPTPVDPSLYSRDVADLPIGDTWVANGDRTVSGLLVYPYSEAVMQQTSYWQEVQRELTSDGVSTIMLAESGLDETAGTGDDYQLVLDYVGIVTNPAENSDCDITIAISGSSFAYCSVGGSSLTSNHWRISSGNIFLGAQYNWYFNDELLGNARPTASFTYSCTELDCTFTDTSTDSDGTIVSWSWSFGDTGSSTAQNPSHSYAAPGTYNVALTVTDDFGATDDVTVPVTVALAPPNYPTALGATAVSPYQIDLGWTDNSNNETSFEIERSPNGSTGWTYIDSVGPDVTTYSNIGLNPNTTHYYRVYAHNSGGNSTYSNVAGDTTFDSSNIIPAASFTFDCVNQGCTLTDTSTDSDGTVVAWSWDFGDGNSTEVQHPVHQYQAAGTYTVELTVTDNEGAFGITSAPATVADPKLHVDVIANVNSTGWTTVDLPQVYTSPVIVGSSNYDETSPPAVVRINNITSTSFDVMVQNPGGGSTVSDVPVHYVVVEEGVYTAANNGVTMEAAKFTSTVTDQNNDFVGENRTYANTYTNPVVLGQVMSYNDADWSVFWARGGNAGDPPSASTLYAGKHVGEDTDTTRADETIGYIVIETGSGTVSSIGYTTAVGSNTVEGMTENPPYNYSVPTPAAPAAVVSMAGMNNLNGGWPVLYGANPIAGGNLGLAIDEDTIADGPGRIAPDDQVAYMVFDAPQLECTASRPAPADTWLFFSLPCLPADAAASRVFAGGPLEAQYGSRWIIYTWDASTGSYYYLNSEELLVEGRGYLYLSYDAFNPITISGDRNSGAAIPLVAESAAGVWNLVGNPYNAPVQWTDVIVHDGVTPYIWTQMDEQIAPDAYDCEPTPATGDCIMWHVMYKGWNGSAYQPRDGFGGDPGTLDPFDAMWVRSHGADTITMSAVAPADLPEGGLQLATLEQPGIENAAATSKTNGDSSNNSANEWYVRLVVRSGDLSDDGNWLGQTSTALDGPDSRDLEEWTPFSSPHLTILFTNPLFDQLDWGYTTDYRAITKKPEGEWPFVVRASDDVGQVTLSWEGDDALFRKAQLVDEADGQVIDLQPGGNYTFTMTGTDHPFRLLFKKNASSNPKLK